MAKDKIKLVFEIDRFKFSVVSHVTVRQRKSTMNW